MKRSVVEHSEFSALDFPPVKKNRVPCMVMMFFFPGSRPAQDLALWPSLRLHDACNYGSLVIGGRI